MKISLYHISKKNHSLNSEWERDFSQRIQKYIPFEIVTIPPLKEKGGLSINVLRNKESELLLNKIPKNSAYIVLDEEGQQYTSHNFAEMLNARLVDTNKQLCFLIGGAYGFNKEIRNNALAVIALSKLTFSHQLARTIFLEQLYRAFTILNNQPYHH